MGLRRHLGRRTLIAAVAIGLGVVARIATLPGPLRWREGRQPRSVARIVAVYPPDNPLFLEGARMAVKDLNDAGGMNGFPVVLEAIPETLTEADVPTVTVRRALALASSIVAKEDVVAVLGHGRSATAVPASTVYNGAKMLYLATHATATSLTDHSFPYVFELQPSNSESATTLAAFAASQNLRRLVVLSDNSVYGQEIARLFSSHASLRGADILYTGQLNSQNGSIDRLLLFMLSSAVFRPSDIDALFVSSASEPDTATFIARARKLGLRMPILGPEYLFSDQLAQHVGSDAMRNVFAFSTYDPQNLSPEAVDFAARFMRTTGQTADLLSAIGFDAVHLVAFAAKTSKSLVAGDLADTLRLMRHEKQVVGATGSWAFDAAGLVTDTNVGIVHYNGVAFETARQYRLPLPADENDLAVQTVLPSSYVEPRQ